jgi:hypothetical protein
MLTPLSNVFLEQENKYHQLSENKKIYDKMNQFVDDIELCPVCGLPAQRKMIRCSFLKVFKCPYDHVYHYGFDGDRYTGDGSEPAPTKLSHNPNLEPVKIKK